MKRIVYKLDQELGTKFDAFLRRGPFLLPSSEEFQSFYPFLSPVIQSINDSLEKLNYNCLVKYQNKTPKDSIWISTEKNLCCHNVDDVILLLKSSDRIYRTEDEETNGFQLTFVEWKNDWDSKCEFRLFFLNSQLHGISQRDCTALFPSIVGERERLRELLYNFGNSFRIQDSLCQEGFIGFECFTENNSSSTDTSVDSVEFDSPMKNSFFVDVYLYPNGEIQIIDFEPLDLCSDFCLFETEEGLNSFPIGTLLVVEQEKDCRLAVFNQNFFPEEESFCNDLLER